MLEQCLSDRRVLLLCEAATGLEDRGGRNLSLKMSSKLIRSRTADIHANRGPCATLCWKQDAGEEETRLLFSGSTTSTYQLGDAQSKDMFIYPCGEQRERRATVFMCGLSESQGNSFLSCLKPVLGFQVSCHCPWRFHLLDLTSHGSWLLVVPSHHIRISLLD